MHLRKLYERDFVVKELSSSALGDNKLKYIPMIGRVHIDLLKYVQREYKLTSYKLDNVSAHFMKGTIYHKLYFGNKKHAAKMAGTLL